MYTATGVPVKNNCSVDFPDILDLDPFCTTGQLSAHPKQSISPSTSLNLLHPSRYRYKLSTVVEHYGAHHYGHYITFRRNVHDGSWYRTSDETVLPRSLDSVLDSNPFLLFYELEGEAQVSESREHVVSDVSVERIVQRAACNEKLQRASIQ